MTCILSYINLCVHLGIRHALTICLGNMVFGSVQLCLEEPKHTEAPVTCMTEAHLWHRVGLSEGSISKLY